jgi:hypothetical protein
VIAFTPPRKKSGPALGTVQDDGNITMRSGHPSAGGQGGPGKGKGKGKPRRGDGSFMQRLEERWDKRREQGPF